MSITLAEVLEESPNNVNLLLSGVSAGEAGAVLLQQHITKNSKLQILELRGSTVGPSGCSRIARSLHEHPCIRHVGLARNGLDISSCIELINALSTCRMLQSLDLEWNSIDDQSATVLAKWLAQPDCTLVALNLERNFITKNGAGTLARALSHNKSLRNLNIGHMRCETEAAIEWGKMLSLNDTLATLNLSGSELLTDGTKHILIGLRTNRSIRALSLQYCQGLTAISELGMAATSADPVFDMSLKELNLQGSRAPPNEAQARGFAVAIEKATGLLGLNISRCVVSDAAMNQMLLGVSLIMSLQVFDVSACGLSVDSMSSMAQVLDRCINLHTLALDDNHLGPKGGQAFAEGLMKAQSLISLSMNNCDLRNTGITALAHAFKKKHLSSLKISNNSFDIDGGKVLIQSLLEEPRYTTLKELDISHNRLTARFSALLGLLFKRHPKLMPICVRGTTISAAVQEAYVDATSIRLSAEAQRKSENEMNQLSSSSPSSSPGNNFSSPTTRHGGSGDDFQNSNDISHLLHHAMDDLESSMIRSGQQQHQQYHHQNTSNTSGGLVTNFHGATPDSRTIPSAVRSAPGETTQRAIQQHKQEGSWIDHEFGETVNCILNSTTNFRTSRMSNNAVGNLSMNRSCGGGGDQFPRHQQHELSLSPNRLKRAESLAGAISTTSDGTVRGTGSLGYGETYKLSDDVSSGTTTGKNNNNQNNNRDKNAVTSLGNFSNAITTISGGADGNNNGGSNPSGETNNNNNSNLPLAAIKAIDSLANVSPSARSVMNASKQSPISRHQAARDLMVKSNTSGASAGGFLHTAGLAPRTDPSPMWARRPQMFDMEASVGESLCVSEPQLKLAFIEIDRERTGLVSRKDVEQVYRRYCVDFDAVVDGKKLDNFFVKYARGGTGTGGGSTRKDGKINYDAFCMLMLSLVNR